MAPGQLVVEADQDRRHAVERAAHDVEGAAAALGHRQMADVEPLGAAPGEVRITEHHRHAGRGRLLAQRIHVAAERPLGIVEEAQRAAVLLVGRDRLARLRERRQCRGRRTRRRRCGLRDVAHEHGGARQHAQAQVATEHVVVVERPQPGTIRAGGVAAGIGAGLELADVAVDAVLETDRRRQRLGRGVGLELGELRVRDQRAPEEVAVDVVRGRAVGGNGVSAGAAKELRAFAADGDDVVEEDAEIVLREGVAQAVADAAEIVGAIGLDVRNAQRRARDLRVVLERRRHLVSADAGERRSGIAAMAQQQGQDKREGKPRQGIHGHLLRRLLGASVLVFRGRYSNRHYPARSDGGRGAGPFSYPTGSTIRTSSPPPSRLASTRRPSCASTISRQSVRPSPVPSALVE